MGVAYIFYNTGIRRRTDMKVGFIGGGNMASAMIGGMIQKGVVSADDILVSVRTEKSVERLTNQFGVQATMENEAVVAGSDLVFLAVKPNQIKNIINLVKNFISPEKIIVSILPGTMAGYRNRKTNKVNSHHAKHTSTRRRRNDRRLCQ